ncbi:MAG: sigma-70 family RNA polymerase sigma factor [Proteobacteria bacterium]|nr:sigma-70 family RNA polymerase sigma factor [Pseudomonadota bacterium]MDA1356890.1 sigma-70 family RNA polymerase sigma factor [Pseudomonadota bacterium]
MANADTQPISQTTFEQALPELRPEIHRYCSRMTGSVIDGEDVLQIACMKAFEALKRGDQVTNLRAWLFRIAHNVTLDYLRGKKRDKAMLNATMPAAETVPQAVMRSEVADSLRPFLALPPRQRSTVIFRDILGYTAGEVANLTDSSIASVKASLHRGRENLKRGETASAADSSPLTREERQRLGLYAQHFNDHNFDKLRDMLSAEVRLELVGRVRETGRQQIGNYFGNYSKRRDWRMMPGLVEGRGAILAFDLEHAGSKPAYFILLEFRGRELGFIRDFRYARYAMTDAQWEVFG